MMKSRFALYLGLAAVTLMPAAFGQRWEFGAGGAGSFYNTRTVSGPGGSADAGFKTGYGFHANLTQVGNRFGGALRYSMMFNDMQLKSSRATTTMSGRSQSIEYDFQYYFKNSEASVRPYLIGGGGVRFFTGSGTDTAVQPLMNVAVLTNTTQMKPVFTGGAGVRVQLSRHVFLRAEMRTSFTQVPQDVITPTYGSTLGGWFLNFLPSVGIGYEW